MPELRRDRAADVELITGATGTGKSHYLRQQLARAMRRGDRVRVWDWKDDHYTLPTFTLGDFVRRASVEPVMRYLPRRDLDAARQFEIFCKATWAVQAGDPRVDCFLVVEECMTVVQPGRAPAWWKEIVELGRVYGFTVRATTQRPAYVDLGFRGAANFVRCGRLGEDDDARAMGRRLGVPAATIQRLPDYWAYVFNGRETVLVNPRGKAVPHVRATG